MPARKPKETKQQRLTRAMARCVRIAPESRRWTAKEWGEFLGETPAVVYALPAFAKLRSYRKTRPPLDVPQSRPKDCPTPQEIAERAAEVRKAWGTWADNLD